VLVLAVFARASIVRDRPEVRGQFTLAAAFNRSEGQKAFFFAGKAVPATSRVFPGDTIKGMSITCPFNRTNSVRLVLARITATCISTACMFRLTARRTTY